MTPSRAIPVRKEVGGLYKQLDKIDIIKKLKPLLMGSGFFINNDGLIDRKVGIGFDTPWYHVKSSTKKRCQLDHHIIFNYFGFIPKRCMECWKVVVSPRNLKELFMLLEVEKALNRPSKCGIELREYTPRHYGGYFYNNSLDEGRERYEEVRKAVSDHISPDVGVILKRGCTEMEMINGPSPYWYYTKEHDDLETMIEERFVEHKKANPGQPDYCLAYVQKAWIRWAASHGDNTYLEFTGGELLWPDTVKYHEGDIDEIKSDMCRARLGLQGVKDEDAVNVLENIGAIAQKYTVRQIAAGLGYDTPSPLMIGGQDETT